MSTQKRKAVLQLPTSEVTAHLEGDEDWLSTLEDPRDATVETGVESQPTQKTT